MKAFCISFALISSLASVHGCALETSCKSREFRTCAFNDNSCRGKATLNLQDKALSGFIPVAFYTLFGTTVKGNSGDGIPAVKLKKVYMQNNALSGVNSLFACSTIEEINLQGNPLTSTQTIEKPSKSIVTLNLASTSQTNVKWLQTKVPNLKTLNLANNQISDLSPLTNLENLVSLNLANNPQISDISTLAGMTTLTSLDLRGNKKITDLTSLVDMTGLTDLKVDPPLQRQARIIASKGTAATKRGQIMSAEMGDIKQVAVTNKGTIEEIKKLTSTIPDLTDKNQKLEARIIQLERKLNQLNQACFAGSNTGARRQLNSDCIEKDERVVQDAASATSILSVATVASAALIFL